jgi:hypothetical protein
MVGEAKGQWCHDVDGILQICKEGRVGEARWLLGLNDQAKGSWNAAFQGSGLQLPKQFTSSTSMYIAMCGHLFNLAAKVREDFYVIIPLINIRCTTRYPKTLEVLL